jgi:DUF1009 family protein
VTDSQPLGIIAGQGQLPVLIARGMKRAGYRVCCVGLRGHFDPELPALCDSFQSAGVARMGRWIRLLKRQQVHQAVMVGTVSKARMHDPWKLLKHFANLIPDMRAVRLWYRQLRHDRRNAVLLAAVADELARSGITLIDSTMHIPDHMATPGVMGNVTPSAQQQADIDFGWPLITQAVELDIGQSMAVRDRDVIAVEAVEGTDAMIARAGQLCKAKGWTLLKTAKREHDMRADVPVIGVKTIEHITACGGRCIALGVGSVILIDKPAVLAAADKAGVAVVGVKVAEPGAM